MFKRLAPVLALVVAICAIGFGGMLTPEQPAHAGGTGGSTVLPVEYGQQMRDLRQLAARDCSHQTNAVASRYYQLGVTALTDSLWTHGYALSVPGYGPVHAQLCHLEFPGGGSLPEVPVIWGGDVSRLLELVIKDCDTVDPQLAVRYQQIQTRLQHRLDQLDTGITVPALVDAKVNACNGGGPVG